VSNPTKLSVIVSGLTNHANISFENLDENVESGRMRRLKADRLKDLSDWNLCECPCIIRRRHSILMWSIILLDFWICGAVLFRSPQASLSSSSSLCVLCCVYLLHWTSSCIVLWSDPHGRTSTLLKLILWPSNRIIYIINLDLNYKNFQILIFSILFLFYMFISTKFNIRFLCVF
jgi:hypothetical protein